MPRQSPFYAGLRVADLQLIKVIRMRYKSLVKILFSLFILLTGYSENVKSEPEELLDAFIAGEIPAFYVDREDTVLMSDLPYNEEDYFSYSVGERIDLDNDGEKEQIINGPYGGIYIDARDGKAYVLAQGDGTAFFLSYTDYDNATWIVYSDTTHAGRQIYWLTKYDGNGNIVDEFKLSAEYWDSPDGKYDENSDFTYRDEKITMVEYETLKKEIFGL